MKTLVKACQIDLHWAGDEITRRPARDWRVASYAEATQVLREIARDISFHGGDPDTAGLVATVVTFAVIHENGIKVGGIARVRYQSKPDILDYL